MPTLLSSLGDFKIVFLSIIIEAFPFLLIGSIIASLIDLYVSENFILRVLPKNRVLQMILMIFVGLIFPVCECTIIPITRKLIKKGMPVSTAIVFMLLVPIINPIAIIATLVAFQGSVPAMILYRIGVAVVVAFIVAFSFFKTDKKDILKPDHHHDHNAHHHCDHIACKDDEHEHEEHHHEQYEHDHDHQCDHIGCNHDHPADDVRSQSPGRQFAWLVKSVKNEFIDVAALLVIGAGLAGAVQVLLPSSVVNAVTGKGVFSVLFMQTLGYSVSLCSHADAFVAAGFYGTFGFFPVLAFLIISPLIDIKNTLVLVGLFQRKFSYSIVLRIFAVTFVIIAVLSFIWGGAV